MSDKYIKRRRVEREKLIQLEQEREAKAKKEREEEEKRQEELRYLRLVLVKDAIPNSITYICYV